MKTITAASVVALLLSESPASAKEVTLEILQSRLNKDYKTDDLKRADKPKGMTTEADFAVDGCLNEKGVEVKFVLKDITDLSQMFYWGFSRNSLRTMQDEEAAVCYSISGLDNVQEFVQNIKCFESQVDYWPKYNLIASKTNSDFVWDVQRAQLDESGTKDLSAAAGNSTSTEVVKTYDLTMYMWGKYVESSKSDRDSYELTECYEGRKMDITTFWGTFEGSETSLKSGKATVDPPTTDQTYTQIVTLPDFDSRAQRVIKEQIIAFKEALEEADDEEKPVEVPQEKKKKSGAMINQMTSAVVTGALALYTVLNF